MNSVKNAIVTMTLLAVGYGAYVVLSDPAPDDLGDLADASVWEAPEVTAPSIDHGVESGLTALNQPPPLDHSGDGSRLDPSLDVRQPGAHSDPYPPSDLQAPLEPFEAPPTGASGTGLPDETARTSHPLSADPGDGNTADVEESDTNFYVSQSGTELTDVDNYPRTNASDLPLPSSAHGSPAESGNESAGVADPRPSYESEFDQTWHDAQDLIRRGQLAEALSMLSTQRDAPSLDSDQRNQLIRLLDQLAGTVIYSSESFLEPSYVVQSGDTLEDLAVRFQVPVQFLARVNGIETPYEIFAGESIKVVGGPFRVEVSRNRNEITVFLGRHYAGRFAARIGAELPPNGTIYTVVSSGPGLEYFDTTTGDRIGPSDPRNPYGETWIGLRGSQDSPAEKVGIHVDRGDPERCCIGVSAVDADDLAAILGPGSTVEIKD